MTHSLTCLRAYQPQPGVVVPLNMGASYTCLFVANGYTYPMKLIDKKLEEYESEGNYLQTKEDAFRAGFKAALESCAEQWDKIVNREKRKPADKNRNEVIKIAMINAESIRNKGEEEIEMNN